MSDLIVLLLILWIEIVNKHSYAFMQVKDELQYIRDDFPLAFLSACIHCYAWWWARKTIFSWNAKCSPLSQKIQTPLLCSKGGEDLQSSSWCKILTALQEHQTAKWSLPLSRTPVVPYQTVGFQFNTAFLYNILGPYEHTWKTDLNWKFKEQCKASVM